MNDMREMKPRSGVSPSDVYDLESRVVPTKPYEVILSSKHNCSPAYAEKMLHDIPQAQVVDRVKFIVERCADKHVVNIGSASGGLHEQIKTVADTVCGIDKDGGPNTHIQAEVDSVGAEWAEHAARSGRPDVAVCGEVLEHMENPGLFLFHLRSLKPRETIITVPNAFGSAGQQWGAKQIENVNRDHVAWYSWRTLKTLVERCGFKVKEFYWYGGRPVFAEGLIFVLGVNGDGA